MIQKHLTKISFSLALAAVLAVGFMTLGSQPAEAVPSCASRLCGPTATNLGTFCLYFEPITQCDFRCFEGVDAKGSCRLGCSPEAL